MGLVFYRIPKTAKTSTILIFDEYRFVDYRIVLNHTMFLYKDKTKNSIVQYIYDINQNVLCYQMDNNIYLSKENKNLIIDIDEMAFQDFEQKRMVEITQHKKEIKESIIYTIASPILAPIMMPAMIVVFSPWVLKDGQ
jgi:hypothetical protein